MLYDSLIKVKATCALGPFGHFRLDGEPNPVPGEPCPLCGCCWVADWDDDDDED